MDAVKIGWGRRALNMDAPLAMPGQMYTRISEGILDPLYATTLCIDGGAEQDAAIFCACDIVIIRVEEMDMDCRNPVLDAIRELVHTMRPALPVNAIIFNATHTHAGIGLSDTPDRTPDGQPIYSGAEYRAFFVRQCAEAICEAWDNRQAGAIAFGYGYAVASHSRRVVYFDDTSLRAQANPAAPNGHCVMYGNTNDAQFSHYEAGADHFLNAMYTFDANKKLTGIVVNVPCPSQLSEHFCVQTSDFWNEVRQMTAEEYGDGVYVLPQCAAAGDLSPRVLHYKQAQARRMALKFGANYDVKDGSSTVKVMAERKDIALRIMESVREIYSWAKKDIRTSVPVYHISKDLRLPRRRVSDQEKLWCEENLKRMEAQLPEKFHGDPMAVRKAVTSHERVSGRNLRAIQRWQTQDAAPYVSMTCHALRVGDIAFATNRFELYMDYMHRIQARSPFLQTFIVQLAGTEGGTYLPTQRGAEGKGYSASVFCNMVGPEGGQVLVEETLGLLHTLADRTISKI